MDNNNLFGLSHKKKRTVLILLKGCKISGHRIILGTKNAPERVRFLFLYIFYSSTATINMPDLFASRITFSLSTTKTYKNSY